MHLDHNEKDPREVEMGCRGRFRAIVHDGNGNEIRSTPFGNNRITLTGFNTLLGGGLFHLHCVAGSGNNAPTESDTALQSYAGKYSAIAAGVTSVNTDPGSGPLFWRLTKRYTFNPGSFGASNVNISEAGIACTIASLASINGSSPLGARGLLVDSVGAPTSVAVAPDEYLDIVWELTTFIPYDSAGTVDIEVDGVMTPHNFLVRPSGLGNPDYQQWKSQGAGIDTAFTFFNPSVGSTNVSPQSGSSAYNTSMPGVGGPGNIRSASDRPEAINSATYVGNSKQRAVTAVWTLTRANIPGGVNYVQMLMGLTAWSVSYNPPLAKTAAKQLNLPFVITLANVV